MGRIAIRTLKSLIERFEAVKVYDLQRIGRDSKGFEILLDNLISIESTGPRLMVGIKACY